jgi:hypothetical protein
MPRPQVPQPRPAPRAASTDHGGNPVLPSGKPALPSQPDPSQLPEYQHVQLSERQKNQQLMVEMHKRRAFIEDCRRFYRQHRDTAVAQNVIAALVATLEQEKEPLQ